LKEEMKIHALTPRPPHNSRWFPLSKLDACVGIGSNQKDTPYIRATI
jgi:hypothetical protein